MISYSSRSGSCSIDAWFATTGHPRQPHFNIPERPASGGGAGIRHTTGELREAMSKGASGEAGFSGGSRRQARVRMRYTFERLKGAFRQACYGRVVVTPREGGLGAQSIEFIMELAMIGEFRGCSLPHTEPGIPMEEDA